MAHDIVGGNDGVYNSATLGLPGYSVLDSDTAAGFNGLNRDVLVADVIWPNSMGRWYEQLQWGRDVLVADVNALKAFGLQGSSASMGPRRFSRGCKTCCSRTLSRTWGFNGAATF